MALPTNYDEFDNYREYLRAKHSTAQQEVNQTVADTLQELKDSAAYQSDALRNGESQPIIATRKATNKCKVTVLPGDNMYIGDLIYVFKEYWLCMEVYVDEYGVRYAEIWMCNQIFNYQDHSRTVIHKYAIIDDGSYSKGSDTRAIAITDNSYTCYISLDNESTALYVDKRLAVDTILNSQGEKILEVGKISWIDIKSKNYGEGSHLMQFKLRNDVYNPETDRLDNKICDYVDASSQPESTEGYIAISGRASIRLGTTRQYVASAVTTDGSSAEVEDAKWTVVANSKISHTASGNACSITVPLDDSLVGEEIILKCESESGTYEPGNMEVVVMSIG